MGPNHIVVRLSMSGRDRMDTLGWTKPFEGHAVMYFSKLAKRPLDSSGDQVDVRAAISRSILRMPRRGHVNLDLHAITSLVYPLMCRFVCIYVQSYVHVFESEHIDSRLHFLIMCIHMRLNV